jgi:hypothetical protein
MLHNHKMSDILYLYNYVYKMLLNLVVIAPTFVSISSITSINRKRNGKRKSTLPHILLYYTLQKYYVNESYIFPPRFPYVT